MACTAQKPSHTTPEYISLEYTSICCGTPNEAPVKDFITFFAKKYKKNNLQVYKQSGLGREGEYKLFINIGGMNNEEKTLFTNELEKIVKKQNQQRNTGSDGYVHYHSQSISKEEFEQESKTSRIPFTEIKIIP